MPGRLRDTVGATYGRVNETSIADRFVRGEEASPFALWIGNHSIAADHGERSRADIVRMTSGDCCPRS